MDHQIHLVPQVQPTCSFQLPFWILAYEISNSVFLLILSNMRHYSDPRTDQELTLEYRDHAGTFKLEKGFNMFEKPFSNLKVPA